MSNHIILIDCPDRKGIVHKVTGVLYRYGLNIEDQAEYVDRECAYFFMRTEVLGKFSVREVLSEIKKVCPDEANVQVVGTRRKKVVIFAGKEGHCLGDLLLRAYLGEMNVDILCVVSNYQSLSSLVKKFNVPFICISHDNLSREDHERKIHKELKNYSFDYLVLAKYMRILTSEFVNKYAGRILNIHHSFLPAFIGANPYQQAFDRGVKIIGATAHFVTEQLDEGPIIAQQVISVDHSKTSSGMKQAGRNIEQSVLSTALHLVLEDRVFVHEGRTVIFD